jgi:hypothetical protein
MLLFSNYGVFLIFTFLIKNHRYGHGDDKQKTFAIIIYIFHVLYALALVGALIPGLWPKCSNEVMYRKIFIHDYFMNLILFVAYMFYYLFGVDFLLALVGVVFHFKK